MKRRSFFNFAGKTLAVAALFEVVRPYLESNQARAQTWQKIKNLSAANLTWRKLTPNVVTKPMYAGVAGCTTQSVALRSDGFVFTSGNNISGQLGDNTATNKSTFVQSTGISNAVAIASGNQHTVALRSDGLVFSCGMNTYGALGDNTTTSRSTFVLNRVPSGQAAS